MSKLKKVIGKILLVVGYSVNKSNKKILTEELLKSVSGNPTRKAAIKKKLRQSKSQLGLDILALKIRGVESPGFFVEFGAADGISLSNSLLLEKQFGWSGILSEPSRDWHSALKKHRTSIVDTRCVYSVTGSQIDFTENYLGELSGIHDLLHDTQGNVLSRHTGHYKVESITLEDLLNTHNAPKHIDLLSIDTEGSELEILSHFDFSKYSFGLISVEHNYRPDGKDLKELLEANGYKQIHPELSDFDYWFVPKTN